jgi:uncharacterized ferredoxin-like protein
MLKVPPDLGVRVGAAVVVVTGAVVVTGLVVVTGTVAEVVGAVVAGVVVVPLQPARTKAKINSTARGRKYLFMNSLLIFWIPNTF